jgi:hypothetical protein
MRGPTLGTLQAENSFSTGRVSAGGKVTAPWSASVGDGGTLAIGGEYGGIGAGYGVWTANARALWAF